MKFSDAKIDFAQAWAVLQVNEALDREVQAMLPEAPPPGCAAYLRDSWPLRRSPSKAFPWANSIIIMAIPFRTLKPVALPRAAEPEFAGWIAGYAARQDYHRAARLMLEHIQVGNRSEIMVDTAPLAEKTLAAIAGIGSIGMNRCLLLPGADAGCFLAAILTDAQLEEQRFPRQDYCTGCRSCGTVVKCSGCVSYLTMEKRGELTVAERKALGDWVFGCSACTAACPGTQLPEDFELDLEWLLMASAGEVTATIRETPLNYAGVTLLRRNALYVLAERHTPRCRELIDRFHSHTGSAFLRDLALF